jgi:hypothetical protein
MDNAKFCQDAQEAVEKTLKGMGFHLRDCSFDVGYDGRVIMSMSLMSFPPKSVYYGEFPKVPKAPGGCIVNRDGSIPIFPKGDNSILYGKPKNGFLTSAQLKQICKKDDLVNAIVEARCGSDDGEPSFYELWAGTCSEPLPSYSHLEVQKSFSREATMPPREPLHVAPQVLSAYNDIVMTPGDPGPEKVLSVRDGCTEKAYLDKSGIFHQVDTESIKATWDSRCECGAYKATKAPRGPAHSDYCPWSK